MEISIVQHQHQDMASNQLMNMEEVMLSTGTGSKSADQNQERKPRPQPEQALKCPRCESTNTKFCYYNNYSLSQPRYFCKGCRRYWTQGGSLRNVPVGGGCRKNNKRSSTTSSSSSSSKKPQDHQQTLITTSPLPILPPLSYGPTDSLSLAPFLNPNPNPSPNFLDIFRSGFLEPASPAGFSNLGSSYGFDGGLGLSCPATMTAAADGDQESKMVMGHQWQFSDGSNNSNSVGVDHHSARDYYNWHGIINSSLM